MREGIYLNRRMAALTGLGFASGLPLALTRDTLQAWLRESGIDLTSIGLLSLVTIPYAIKVLWAPLMDRPDPPLLRRFGRRRGWLIGTQLGLIAAIAAMAALGTRLDVSTLWLIAMIALVVAFMSASQDIVADAYRADVLAPRQRGAGAAVFTTGYRVAMIASGAGALMLADRLGWPVVYLLAAALVGAGVVTALFAPEPAPPSDPPAELRDAFVLPFAQLLARRAGMVILLFVALFRLPDIMAQTMTVPFLLDLGISKAELGSIRQALGLGIMIAGALAGGALVARLGLARSLITFGLLQAISNAGFWLLAIYGADRALFVTAIAVESFCGGLVAAGFVAFLMSCCDRRYSATQYALLTSVVALASSLGGAPCGLLAERLGYATFFALSILAAAPGMLLLPWIPRGQEEPDRHLSADIRSSAARSVSSVLQKANRTSERPSAGFE